MLLMTFKSVMKGDGLYFSEVPVPIQESEWSFICMLGVSILIFDFRIVMTVWYLCSVLFSSFHYMFKKTKQYFTTICVHTLDMSVL